MVGKSFGEWLVLSKSERSLYFVCECSCGAIKDVYKSSLKKGVSRSCGCKMRQHAGKHSWNNDNERRLSSVLSYMIQRCNNPKTQNYHRYGGRGISVCSEWIENRQSFVEWAIRNGWHQGLEVDRINNDGNYCPDNCRCVTHMENCKNKKNIQTATMGGVTKTIRDWERDRGMPKGIISYRLKAGWNTAEAINVPTSASHKDKYYNKYK